MMIQDQSMSVIIWLPLHYTAVVYQIKHGKWSLLEGSLVFIGSAFRFSELVSKRAGNIDGGYACNYKPFLNREK